MRHGVHVGTERLWQPHEDIEAAIAVEYLPHGLAADRHLDHVLHVGHVEPQARHLSPLQTNRQNRQAGGLLELGVGRAGHGRQHGFDAFAHLGQHVDVVAEHLHRHVAAHAGNQLVEAHLNRLDELVVVAGHERELALHLLDQVGLQASRIRPLIAGLEHHVGVGHARRHGIGGDLSRADLGEHIIHFGIGLELALHGMLHVDRR